MLRSAGVQALPRIAVETRRDILDAQVPAPKDRLATPLPAVFVAHAQTLSSARGGAQICTAEYLETIRLAGFAPDVCAVEHDRRLTRRLSARIRPRPYSREWHPQLVGDLVRAVERSRARALFLNLANLAPLAMELKAHLGDRCSIVLLSHGLESVDHLHRLGSSEQRGTRSLERAKQHLAACLAAEVEQRAAIDHVVCLSAFESEIERWLGARSVSWVPRTIPSGRALPWRPAGNRLGLVSTLDHPPNRDGIVRLAQALERLGAGIDLRVVGGPEATGRDLAARFAFVSYLGSLDDSALEREAASWSAFVHPLFCYAKGCSTKLAVALSWCIPVVTTTPGRRGYIWRHGDVPTADSPDALAALAVGLTDFTAAAAIRDQVALAARSAPTLPEVADALRASLAPILPRD